MDSESFGSSPSGAGQINDDPKTGSSTEERTKTFYIARGTRETWDQIQKMEVVTLASFAELMREAQQQPFEHSFLEWCDLRAAMAAGDVDATATLKRAKHTAWFVCAMFKSIRRNKNSIVGCTAFAGDADQPGTKRETLLAALDELGCSYLLATSISHGCEGRERYRVILPLSTPLSPNRYAELWSYMNTRLDGILDLGAKDPTRLNFMPRIPTGADGHTVIVVDDRPWFDVSALNANAPAAIETKPAQQQRSGATIEQLRDFVSKHRDPSHPEPEWWKTVRMIHFETGGSPEGLDLADEWSAKGANYTGREPIEARWNSPSWNDPDSPAITLEGLSRRTVALLDDFSPHPSVEPTPPRFNPTPASKFAVGPEPEWLLDGVLPQDGETVVIFGQPGCGKSVLLLDICASVARGVPWQGLETKQGRVVYIAGEGVAGFRQRIRAYAQANSIELSEIDNLLIVSEMPNLLTDDDANELASELQILGPIKLIVIDTLARATPGGNENSAEDVGRALAHCKLIHNLTGALVCLVHHSGKDQARGARGWSGLLGAVDTEIEIIRENDGNIRQMHIGKQRDGADHYTLLHFELLPVALGHDAKNREITSVVIKRTAVNEGDDDPSVTVPTAPARRAIWETFEKAQRKMPLDELFTLAVAQLPHDPASSKKDRRRDRVRQAFEAMLADGQLWVHNGAYSIPRNRSWLSEFEVIPDCPPEMTSPTEHRTDNSDLVS